MGTMLIAVYFKVHTRVSDPDYLETDPSKNAVGGKNVKAEKFINNATNCIISI